jgi:rhamnulokinase
MGGGETLEVVHVVGGGANNHVLNDLIAARCGRPVIAGPAEATTLGNLLVQARTLGELPAATSIRDAARRSTTTQRYEPDIPRILSTQ